MNIVNRVSYLNKDVANNSSTVMTGWVTDSNDGQYLIDDDTSAQAADGLGLALIKGDYVAYLATGNGSFVVCLLKAAPRESIELSFPFAQSLKLVADHIELVGQKSISLKSLHNLSFLASKNIKLACENLFQSAAGTVVNVMSNWVQQCDQGSIQARQLLRTDAGSQIITASKDLRLDAERINMG
ncbi:MAG: hypothetical protein JKX81_04240 [Arenicella sp.]|nr:hypothetical protein [Arenicella sp.]